MRDVLAIRLSEAERHQVAGAAERFGKTVSAFVREAALQASALAVERATVREQKANPNAQRVADCADDENLVALEPVRHMVDGEWVESYR
jgi:uncharacterized protein (DUF1778 family)